MSKQHNPDKYASFNCDGCGLCCEKANCIHFTEERKCAIYDTRPLICNVDKGYEMFFKDKISKIEWYDLNYASCASLKQKKEGK
jgi:uncharacterized protein